jgi:ribosomal protein S27E
MVIDFRCSGCNAPLTIPQNPNEKAKCTFCGVESLLKTPHGNAAQSGIPLKLTAPEIHERLVRLFMACDTIPIDLFEQAEVIREERYYVPAYCFYCNSMASFTYEVGITRNETYTTGKGSNKQIHTRVVTDWNPNSSMASASPTVFASANRKMSRKIQNLYLTYDPKKLVDIKDFSYPNGVQTLDNDYPEAASFSEKVTPYVNDLLRQQANGIVAKLNHRNLVMNGGNIQKESAQVLLGLYRIVYTYGGREYSVWTDGFGANPFHDGIPQDLNRKQELISMEKQHAEMCHQHSKADTLMWFLAIITLGIYLIASPALQKKRERAEQKRLSLQKIQDFKDVLTKIKTQFTESKSTLKGIYK